MPGSAALTIEGLNKTYGNGVVALKNVNLKIEAGDFYALLGPNGAGKSTTIGILAGLVNKTSGRITALGKNFDSDKEAFKRLLGLVPQEVNLAIFERCFDIIVDQAGYYGIPASVAKQRAEVLLKQLELWDKRFEMARNLSGGMKRRLMIARAMAHDPQILILDEPTAGVDVEIRRGIWAFLADLNKHGKTIILTTHYLEEVEQLCRKVAIIQHGQILTDTTLSKLIKTIAQQTFILDIDKSPTDATLAELAKLGPVHRPVSDEPQIAIQLAKNHALNPVFDILSAHGLQVLSLRPKSNRLEELFVELTHGNQA